MKAIVAKEYGNIKDVCELKTDYSSEYLETVSENEIVIDVNYAGVNPIDWKIIKGWSKNLVPGKPPLIPGGDFSGIVSKVGSNIQHLKIGDQVFGNKPYSVPLFGTMAEKVKIDYEKGAIGKVPAGISMEEAGGLPLVTITAYFCIFNYRKLKAGERVIVINAAGSVGYMAVQMAKNLGAEVVAVCGARSKDYVGKLNPDLILDYSAPGFDDALQKEMGKSHLIIDCVGGDKYFRLADSAKYEHDSAIDFVTLNGKQEHGGEGSIGLIFSLIGSFIGRKIKKSLQISRVDYHVVASLDHHVSFEGALKLLEKGNLKCPSVKTFKWEKAIDGLVESESHNARGKIVLSFV